MGGTNQAQLLAVRLPPGPEHLGLLREAWERGDALFPLDPRLPPAEIRRLLDATRPARLVGPEGSEELAGPMPLDPDVALVIATSGTAGEPKAVELTRDCLRAAAGATAARLETGPGDRWLCCLPLHHVAGMAILVRSLLAGSEPVVHPRFEPEAVARAGGVSLVSLVPTMLARLLDSGVDLARFRWVLLGGGPIAPGLLRRAREAGVNVVTTYGLTETAGGVVYDGAPLDGVEVRISGEGEVLLRGPTVMRGYRGRPDLTARALEGGWLHTGDAGAVGPDGALRVLGRLDEMIVTGGEKVAPAEVEAVLSQHPLVAEAAAVGVPDPEWGQRVTAVVVLSGEARPGLEELRAFVGERLAGYKAPREVVFVGSLPRAASGKLLRSALLELARRGG